MIELANRNVVQMIPVVHAIVSDVNSTVVAQDHVIGVCWIYPQRVVVNVNTIIATIVREFLATVLRTIK